MAITVDPIRDYGDRVKGAARRCGTLWCHMMSDGNNLGELHAFAARIGIRRRHFQDSPRTPHYDLIPSKRALAVKLGAEEVTTREQLRRAGVL